MKIEQSVSLASRAWWKIGGVAEYFCEPTSIEELREAYLWGLEKKLEVTALGGGTNVLISDDGISGLVLSFRNLKGLQSQIANDRLEIVALAGTPKSELTKLFLKHKLAPALFMCGLPGDIGGGIVMNAGVSEKIEPREFVEIVDWFEVLKPDGSVQRYEHDDVKWVYRKTEAWQPGLVVRAQISWPMIEKPEIMNQVREATKRRMDRQPLTQPSCGSTFKNPPNNHAGALIEKAGLKGFQIGKAQVSPKHANFIVNLGGAAARDVHAVIQHVRKTVFDQFGIELETEVRYLGSWKL